MEGLRELRGMVVFPVEETTRGYSWYSGDYADYAAHLANTSYETYKLRRLRGQDNLHVTTGDYARLRPAGPRLREHSCSLTAIIALLCRKKAAQVA